MKPLVEGPTLWGEGWEYYENRALYVDPCKHCIPIGTNYIVPRLVVATSGDPYEAAGICLDCLLEMLDKRVSK